MIIKNIIFKNNLLFNFLLYFSSCNRNIFTINIFFDKITINNYFDFGNFTINYDHNLIFFNFSRKNLKFDFFLIVYFFLYNKKFHSYKAYNFYKFFFLSNFNNSSLEFYWIIVNFNKNKNYFYKFFEFNFVNLFFNNYNYLHSWHFDDELPILNEINYNDYNVLFFFKLKNNSINKKNSLIINNLFYYYMINNYTNTKFFYHTKKCYKINFFNNVTLYFYLYNYKSKLFNYSFKKLNLDYNFTFFKKSLLIFNFQFFLKDYYYTDNNLTNIYDIDLKKDFFYSYYYTYSLKIISFNFYFLCDFFLCNFFFNIKRINLLNFTDHSLFLQEKNFLYKLRLTSLYKSIFKNIIFFNDVSAFKIISYYNYNFLSNKFINDLASLLIFEDFNNDFSLDELNENPTITLYNNHYPVLSMRNYFKNYILAKFDKNRIPFYLKFFQYVILNFFESFLNKKIMFKICTNLFLPVTHNPVLLNIYNNYYFHSKVKKDFIISEFLEIIWFSFQLKDLNLLIDWFSRNLEETPFRNHKKLLGLFKELIVSHGYIFIEVLRIKGFFFDIRGKVGVTGNAKKRHFFFRIGKINMSKKSLKIDHQQRIVRTITGSLGITMILSY